jgi:hypothetical protein
VNAVRDGLFGQERPVGREQNRPVEAY